MVNPIYRDIAMGALWAGSNLLLIVAAWRLAGRFFPGDDEDQLVVHAIVAGWACVAGTSMVLGSVGALTSLALIAVVAIGAGLVLNQGSRCRGNPPARSVDSDEVGLSYRIAKYLFSIFIGFHIITNGLGRFPEDWDTLMYHLSRIDQWIQSGSLFVADCYNWSHPGNNELIGFWMVAPFSGDFLISLNNLPAVGLLGFASISLGRGLGLSRVLSYLSAAAIVSNAVVFRQLLDAKNDIAVTGLFVACLNYGLRAARKTGIAELIWGGLGIGLLAGAKYNGLAYAAVALATAALIVALGRGPRAMVRTVTVWCCCLMLWGGFWYVRNAIMVGNPLYPMGLTRSSNVLARIYPELHRSSFWGRGQPDLLPLAMDAVWRMAGPADLVALLAAPVAVIWLVSSAFFIRGGHRPGLEVWIRRVLVLWIVGSGAALLVTPFAVEDIPDTLNHLRDGYAPVRFGLCFLSVSLLAFSVVLQGLSRGIGHLFIGHGMSSGPSGSTSAPAEPTPPLKWMTRLIALVPLLLWAVAVAVQFVIQSRRLIDDFLLHLLVTIVLFEAAWILWLSCELKTRLRGWIASALILALGLGIAWSCGRFSSSWHRNYTAHYDRSFGTEAFARIPMLTRQPKRICVLYYRAYPFHGSMRHFRVFQPMWVPSIAWLLDYLKLNEIDLLILSKDSPLYPGWRNYNAITIKELVGDRRWHPVHEDASFEIFEGSISHQGSPM